MKKYKAYIRSILSAAAAVCLVTACSKKPSAPEPEPKTTPNWHSQVPRDTDMLVVIDMKKLRESEFYSGNASEPRSEALQAEAGFSYDDIEVFAIASDIDSFPPLESLKDQLSLDPEGRPDPTALSAAELEGINITVLLALKEAISWSQAEAAVEVFFSSVTNATIEKSSQSESLTVRQTSSATPLLISLSPDGKTLIMNTDSAPPSPSGRADEPHALGRIHSIETAAPVVIAMSASRKMQEKLTLAASHTNQADRVDASTVILNTALKSFSSFKGFTMTLAPSDKIIELYLEMEMGSESDALEAEAAVKNILIPLVTLSLTQYSETAAQEPLLQKTTTSVRNNRVILRSLLKAQTPPMRQASGRSEP